MPVIIHNPPRIDPRSRMRMSDCQFRDDLTDRTREGYGARIEALREVVKGNDVIEPGVGLLDGVAALTLACGCVSYTGVDPAVPCEGMIPIHPLDSLGRIDESIELQRRDVPAEAKFNPRVRFQYGIDLLTYLKDKRSNSVVSVSTGFFDEVLLVYACDQEYVREMIMELCRATKSGTHVGLHQIFYRNGKPYINNTFIEQMQANGVNSRRVQGPDVYRPFYVLEKP